MRPKSHHLQAQTRRVSIVFNLFIASVGEKAGLETSKQTDSTGLRAAPATVEHA